ncbi:NitT/TauT family transport system substrate-binding protein [Agromyces terreus]|uniref:NitT/TauT family transport system substrate-binding protein n=1 Tax=Agromyces terreus TaxID=424795 RepID=A0A9X2GVB0_9MICO|nr:ABC transporter substrate-binding protein [Agromyces terreus]MCP2369660.1 NitT/TauT family transport system substrate-binding protein [Agromyces terreus]
MRSLHSRGIIAATAAAAALSLTLAGCSSSGSTGTDSDASEAPRETVSLNVGYIDTSINGVGVIAPANELGLWEKYGIDVTLIPFTNGPTQIQAMQAGQIDVGYIGGGAIWMPASGQATVIAPSEESQGDVVLARAGSGVEEPADLKGQKVGVPEGGSGEMILALALLSAGLTMDDVEKVVLDPPSIVSAYVGDQIDVAAIFSPLSAQIMDSVPDTVTVAQNTDFPDTSFLGAWVASNEAVTDKADAVERFLEVYAEVNDYRIENTDQVVEWSSTASGAPADQLAQQAEVSKWTPSDEILANNEDGTTFDQFESLEEVFVETGRMDAVNDPSTFVNVDLFAQAMAARS